MGVCMYICMYLYTIPMSFYCIDSALDHINNNNNTHAYRAILLLVIVNSQEHYRCGNHLNM